ncbi:MAG: class I SAM-dependent methyltransferase [Candidatus Nezhaarchaeales archaeon]
MKKIEEKARAKMRDIIETYDAIAEGFSNTRRYPWIEIVHLLGEISNKTLLDIGCGNGRHLVELAKGASIAVGIDLSKKLIKIAKTRISRLGVTHKAMLVLGDMLFMPFRPESFDSIACIAVMHHVPTKNLRQLAVSEIARVLRSGGLAVISAWYRWQKKFVFDVLKSFFMKLVGVVFEFGDTYISWKSKGKIFKRFFHIFTISEMKDLINIEAFEFKDLKLVAIGSKRLMNVVAVVAKR